jgi:V8-like Glu-specific endopeptidase
MWKYEELRKTLASLYYSQDLIVELLRRAGFSPGDFNLQGKAGTIWTFILTELQNRGGDQKVKVLVAKALEDYSENRVLSATMQDQPDVVKSPYAGEQPAWKGSPSRGKLEKIMSQQSTLLPINFLEKGMIRSGAVGKVVTPEGSGTGFLISDQNLFITNNHVLPNKELAAKSKVRFNYQATLRGTAAAFEDLEIDADTFRTSVEDDWSVATIKGNPIEKYRFISLKGAKTKKDDFVNIIQHPGGEAKQIAMYHNVVTYADDRIVQYLTDTMPGSSGAPVFNSKWEVVALHHSGGWLEEPEMAGEVLRNEGIAIGRIIDALKAQGFNI